MQLDESYALWDKSGWHVESSGVCRIQVGVIQQELRDKGAVVTRSHSCYMAAGSSALLNEARLHFKVGTVLAI